MKTLKVLLISAFCLIAFQMNAQITIGVKAGYTNAWQEYGDVQLPEGAEIDVSGSNISGSVYYQLGKYLSVGMEPGYVRRGAACVPGWNGGINPIFRGDTRFYLNYVEAPLMISGKLPLFKNKFEFFGKAGYGPTFMTSAYQEDIDLNGDVPAVTTKIELGEDSFLNRWDHGFYGGLGLGFNFGKNQIFVETDYHYGLKDAEQFNTSKNRSISYCLGYAFRL